MAKRIEVLVVDDSAYMRKVVSNMLQSDEEIFVVDTARDGLDALEKIKKWKPDVVTLDVEMPRMDGLTALQKIMVECPTPVVMLSSLTQEGSETTIKALTLGAVDFVPKPSGAISLDIARVKEELIRKIKVCAKASLKNIRALQMIAPIPKKEAAAVAAKPLAGKTPSKVVVIGSSTGGPNALQQVVPKLPADLPAAVLIVQHMPPGFTKSLADRLNDISGITVKEASAGDTLQTGVALLAPGGYHMNLVSSTVIGLNQNPPVHSVRPAVDVTMESVVNYYGPNVVGVVLTGMGYDGSGGASAIKRAGGKVIAQNEDTCVVYGMPRVVVEMGKADKVLPITEIADEIVKML
ncbi:response regulator receiver modulated CheB methylesterase [Thermincola ferriacetica]|uniref:Protein-glutamate methylesterase/protein-glutamine glutaminase n=1 Tax=Thermincola ferriacetica TaxID=281456 RepID=A0A0L6W291_9FIRM|nr:chemotaxis response regulator protein-glutamate methylesterase [Thermincola ferriacetica]KNZ69199.1 response regulator receiver modulated CheB methylesterase [Thermincola ferriacetica]